MKVDKKTRITLTHEEIKKLIMQFIKEQGYKIDMIEFNMNEYIDYGVKTLQLDGCTIICAE